MRANAPSLLNWKEFPPLRPLRQSGWHLFPGGLGRFDSYKASVLRLKGSPCARNRPLPWPRTDLLCEWHVQTVRVSSSSYALLKIPAPSPSPSHSVSWVQRNTRAVFFPVATCLAHGKRPTLGTFNAGYLWQKGIGVTWKHIAFSCRLQQFQEQPEVNKEWGCPLTAPPFTRTRIAFHLP